MNLDSLYYFLVTAEELHITKAAQRLFISQQSLSVQIQSLEKHYGVKLFERKPKLRLTPAGEIIYDMATHILELENKTRERLSEITNLFNGKITLGITLPRARVFIPEIWRRYRERYPNVEIVLVEENTIFLEQKLVSGKLDMYIGMDAIENADVDKISLLNEPICFIISDILLHSVFPDHYEEYKQDFAKGVKLDMLEELPFILFPHGNRLRPMIDECFHEVKIKPNVVFETSSHELICTLCQRGDGAGFVAQMYLTHPFQMQKQPGNFINAFPVFNKKMVNKTILALRKGYGLAPHIAYFIHTTQEVFNDYIASVSINR